MFLHYACLIIVGLMMNEVESETTVRNLIKDTSKNISSLFEFLLNIPYSRKQFHKLPMFQYIYHNSELIAAIYRSKIMKIDDFINLKLKYPPDIIKDHFNIFKANNKTSASYLSQFIYENFESGDFEYETITPGDWKAEPYVIKHIQDNKLKEMALMINDDWKYLVRKFKKSVGTNREKYNTLYLNHTFILPSSILRTFYYWETYWIILGLLISEMEQTVREILENFVDLIEQYGHIPSSGSVYMLGRSHTPLFVRMVYEYYKYTQDLEFVRKHIPSIEKEMTFWIQFHSEYKSQIKEYIFKYTCDKNDQGKTIELLYHLYIETT